MTQEHANQDLLTTPLHALHVEEGAKMVPFAGYDMPVQYPLGVKKEHLHTRDAAGLLMFLTWGNFVFMARTQLLS